MVDLRSYQLDAVTRMKPGCILKGGVGSGKSRTALAFFMHYLGCSSFDDLLYLYFLKTTHFPDLYIITTAHKRDSKEWEKELGIFLLSTDTTENLNNSIDLSAKVDSWNNISKYEEITNSFFIFDEQRVIGSGAWTKSFLKIASKNKWILLSATPGDRWMDYVPVFVANGYYKNRTEFIRRHVVFDRFSKYPKVSKYLDVPHLNKIKEDIIVDMDYRHKIETVISPYVCSYNMPLYDKVTKERFDPYKKEPIRDASGLCYTLRRITTDNNMSKISELAYIFKKHQKVIIFYNYEYELTFLKAHFKSEYDGCKDFGIGELNGHKHDNITILNDSYKSWAYLVQYNAGSEGWNCVLCNTIVFFSLSYSYRMMKQASGRINRLNTPFEKLYYYLLYTDSDIDKAIIRALKTKKSFNEHKFVTNF